MHFMDAVAAERAALSAEHDRQDHERELEARYVERCERTARVQTRAAANTERWYFAACGFRA